MGKKSACCELKCEVVPAPKSTRAEYVPSDVGAGETQASLLLETMVAGTASPSPDHLHVAFGVFSRPSPRKFLP